ncbi:hypothetical protein P9850_01985 [Anoxybacillus rupiensis]|uniref:Uncharacterized protein n=1 Tax=Anoxybacteroides rupiense TaxID=311460 RepID=A0ABD5IQT6_9BACL|nr:hypothetical protein [Anoxybacillus rupiensis]
MEILRIKENFDYKKLEELDYRFVPIEAGYVSKDLATIVLTHRLGQKRKILQYMDGEEKKVKHLKNVEELRRIGAVEEPVPEKKYKNKFKIKTIGNELIVFSRLRKLYGGHFDFDEDLDEYWYYTDVDKDILEKSNLVEIVEILDCESE